jgi:hypothetical protein
MSKLRSTRLDGGVLQHSLYTMPVFLQRTHLTRTHRVTFSISRLKCDEQLSEWLQCAFGALICAPRDNAQVGSQNRVNNYLQKFP